MKAIAVLLSFSVLLLGCYVEAPLVKSEVPPADEAVVFYLADGSHVASRAGEHARRDGGYDVAGSLVRPEQTAVPFQGVLHDGDIQKVTVEHVDVLRTSIVAALGSVALFYFIVLIGFSIDGFGGGHLLGK